jgi:hypothetical protein
VFSDAPLYLVSVPRSGATLLAAMLNSHKSIAMFNEPWFFQMLPKYGNLKRHRNGQTLVRDLSKSARGFGVLLDGDFEKHVLAEVTRLRSPRPLDALDIFLRFYAKRLGKPRWGVKQPMGIFDVPLLLERFPDLQVIHLVRDPRATAAYRMGKKANSRESVYHSLHLSISCSRSLLFAHRDNGLNPKKFFELKYEELVLNPEMWLRRICEFLKEDYDPAMLGYHQALNPYVPRRRNGDPQESHVGVLSPVHTREIQDWKNLLTWRETAVVEKICHKEMLRYGYAPKQSEREAEAVRLFLSEMRLGLWRIKRFFKKKTLEAILHTFRKTWTFLIDVRK